MKINILLFFFYYVYYVNAQTKLGGILEDITVICPNVDDTVDKCVAIVYTKKNKGNISNYNLEDYLNWVVYKNRSHKKKKYKFGNVLAFPKFINFLFWKY
jgi:hypothetical protein